MERYCFFFRLRNLLLKRLIGSHFSCERTLNNAVLIMCKAPTSSNRQRDKENLRFIKRSKLGSIEKLTQKKQRRQAIKLGTH